MGKTLDFYFDFSSPYGYFGAQKIDKTAEEAGREALWYPIVLGPIFKETGGKPFVENPMKEVYGINDWNRLARYMKVSYNHPHQFPINTVAAARAFYWIDDQDKALAKTFAKAIYKAYFAEQHHIGQKYVVLEIADGLGIDTVALGAALEDAEVKARLNKEVDIAIEKGVVGSPYFIIDGEGFWGADRLWMIKRWMKEGGW